MLGGGGAKGAAHVGVIRVLEEMRIPIDCIVGTSMGALVGGTYATGIDAGELEHRIEAISWNDTIAFQDRHSRLPMRRKLAGVTEVVREPARQRSRRIHPAWWVAVATFLSVVCAAGARSSERVWMTQSRS